MGFKPDLYDDQLDSFDTVGLVIWPVKVVPKMTYYASSGTLNHIHTHSLMCRLYPVTHVSFLLYLVSAISVTLSRRLLVIVMYM